MNDTSKRFELFMNDLKDPGTIEKVVVDRRTYHELDMDNKMRTQMTKTDVDKYFEEKYGTELRFIVPTGESIRIEKEEDIYTILQPRWTVVRKCEFCDPSNRKDYLRGDDGIYKDSKSGKHYIYAEHFRNEVVEIEANYCPKCGRVLE